MPAAIRVIDRIQDASDFAGSLTDTYYLQYSSSTGKFSLTAVSGGSVTDLLVNGATVGTSGVGVVAMKNGTAPTSQPADVVQLFPADYTTGDARLLVLTEQGRGLWLGNGTIEARAPASGAGSNITTRASNAISGNENGGNVVLTPGALSGSGHTGQVVVSTNGTSAYPALVLNNETGTGLYSLTSNLGWAFAMYGTGIPYAFYYKQLRMSFNTSLGFSDSWLDATASASVGLSRPSSGVLLVTNGSSGVGKFLTASLVEANTADSGSPNILTATESRTTLTNEGATAENYHTLPTAVAGLDFEFICQDSDGIRIVAGTGDTIRYANQVSGDAGYIASTAIGSAIRLIAINATEWVVRACKGVWNIDGGTALLNTGAGVVVMENATVPSAATNTAQLLATDYSTGDSRALVVSETGTPVWIGNGAIESKAPSSGAGNDFTAKASDAISGNENGGSVLAIPGLKSGSGEDGAFVVRQPGGTPDTDEIQFYHDGTNGHIDCRSGTLRIMTGGVCPLYFSDMGGTIWLNTIVICYNGGYKWWLSNEFFGGPTTFKFGLGTDLSAPDVALTWAQAGVFRVTDGSTGMGSVLTKSLIEANTADSGSPNILTATESRTTLTNEGSTAENYHTLPTAVAGLDFEFVCQDGDGIRVVANADDTIRDVATVSSTAGYIRSSTVGSVVRLKAINATEWVVVSKQGTWTIDS